MKHTVKPNQYAVQMLHFVTAIDEERRMVSFCCEGQPLATVRSFGFPTRCPICGKKNPFKGEKMSKSILQQISEKTGCDLSPIGMARDRKLRELYEACLKARGTPEEVATYEAFAKFVRQEYQSR